MKREPVKSAEEYQKDVKREMLELLTQPLSFEAFANTPLEKQIKKATILQYNRDQRYINHGEWAKKGNNRRVWCSFDGHIVDVPEFKLQKIGEKRIKHKIVYEDEE